MELHEVRHVVLDEADTLCDTFYQKEASKILPLVPAASWGKERYKSWGRTNYYQFRLVHFFKLPSNVTLRLCCSHI